MKMKEHIEEKTVPEKLFVVSPTDRQITKTIQMTYNT